MNLPARGKSEPSGGLTEDLERLRHRIDVARGRSGGDDVTQAAMLADLETAHEELRVAGEEVRAQRAELDRLLEAQRLGVWQHDRLVAAVPVPIFVTDLAGRVQTVNPAGAALLRLSVTRVVHKPVQAFVDYSDRGELRRLLNASVRDGSDFTTTVTLLPRNEAPVRVRLVVAVNVNPVTGGTEVTWLVLVPPSDGPARSAHGPASSVRALVDLTTLPLHKEDERETLRQVAVICAGAIGPRAEVTVTVGEPAVPTVLASTGELAQELDGAQMISGEGPCQDAWRTGTTVTSGNVGDDPRWPRLARRLADVPPHAALAIPITIGDHPTGVLNVYFRAPGEPDAATLEDAKLLGAAVAAVLHEIEAKEALETVTEQLRQAMASRAPIEQAKGLIMASRGCTADEAFAVLTKMSNHAHVKIRDLAVQMVQQAARQS
jgi:GAF domain-containing protein